ncbi:MAG: DUF2341 domain-containing protein [Candidatus Saccharibacteria bacterium]
MDINGTLTISGGNFVSTSGTMFISGSFTKTGGSFSANAGVITLDGGTASVLTCQNAVFNSVTVAKNTYSPRITVNAGCTIPLAGDTASGIFSIYGRVDIQTSGNFFVNSDGMFGDNGVNLYSGSTLTIPSPTASFSVRSDFRLYTGSTYSMAGTSLTVGETFYDQGVLPSGLNLTLNGNNGTDMTCGPSLNWNLVTLSKGAGAQITVNSGCVLPLGTNPISTGSITNSGRIDVTGNWTVSSYTSSGGTLNMTGDTLTIANYDLILTSGSFPASVVTLFVARSISNVGNMLATGADLTLNSSGTGVVTCGTNYSWSKVTFSKDGASRAMTVSAGCILPLGTDPVSQGAITNNGEIDIIGNWTLNGSYTSSTAGSKLIMTGNTITTNYGGNLFLTAGTFPASITTLNLEGSIDNSGNLLPSGVALTLDSGYSSTLTCGTNYSWGSVTFSKTAYNDIIIVNAGCILPLGTDPSSIGAITNSGRIDIIGNWTLTGSYTSSAASSILTMTGNTITVYSSGLTLTAGTFPAAITTLNIDGVVNNSGNLLPNGILLTLSSATDTTLTCGNAVFSTIILNKNSETSDYLNVGGNCSMGNFTRTRGVINNPASAYTFNLTANLAVTGTGNFGGANFGINFTGDQEQTLSSTVSLAVAITVNKTGGSLKLASPITTTSAFNVAAGVFDLDGRNLSAGSLAVQATGSLMMTGLELVPVPTLEPGSTVIYKSEGDGVADYIPLKQWNYHNLTIQSGEDTITDSAIESVSGEVVHWDLDEAGLNIIDYDNGIAGTATATTSTVPGQFGNARNFNGTSSSYVVSNTSSLIDFSGAQPLSISMWYKPTSIPTGSATHAPIAWGDGGQSAASIDKAIRVKSDGRAYGYLWAGSAKEPANNTVLTPGNWYHLTLVYDGVNGYMYVGDTAGSPVAATSTFNHATPKIVLSVLSGTTWVATNGAVDDVRVFNRALTQPEVAKLGTLDFVRTPIASLDVPGNFTILSGQFEAPTQMTVTGNWSNSGTFIARGGKVVLSGTNQTISGSTVFSGFEKIAAASDTLTFPGDASKLQTFTGTMTLKGTTDNPLTLASSNPGTHFRIDPQAVRSIEYLNVSWSDNINATQIVTSGRNITDGNNNIGWDFSVISTPEVAALATIIQATDGSGHLSFNVTVTDGGGDNTKLKVEYSDDSGSNWYDPIIFGVTPSSGSVDSDDAQTYQIGSINPIDTSTGPITLTIAWDTKSSGNGHGSLDDVDTTGFMVRVTPNDNKEDGLTLASSVFDLDNLKPSIPADFGETYVGGTKMSFSWTATTENHFSHYEVWYGTNQADVEGRTGTAQEWDDADDASLAAISSAAATVIDLVIDTPYFFKLYPMDVFGNANPTATLAISTNRQFVWDGGGDAATWSSADNWDTNMVPGNNDDVIIESTATVSLAATTTIRSLVLGNTGGTVTPTLNFAYDAQTLGALTITPGDLTVYPGATITHTEGTTVAVGTVYIDVQTGNATVAGNIDATYKGYQRQAGPGHGTTSSGSPAGHGGTGAWATGPTYDSITDPSQMGSGGNHVNRVTPGGGLVKLNVAGTFNLSGNITANGKYGEQYSGVSGSGGASGGTVNITAGTLMGNGIVAAIGGAGAPQGGGGGGGRIAVRYTTDSSTISFRAFGGPAYDSSYYGVNGHGGAGTIFRKAAAQTYGELIVDNNDQEPFNYSPDMNNGKTPVTGTMTFDSITVRNYGYLDIQPGADITYGSLDWSDHGIIADNGGSFALFNANADVTIPETAYLVANTPKTFHSLIINGTLTHSANYDTAVNKLNLTVTGDAAVSATGAITADYTGFWAAKGPGAGVAGGGAAGGGGYGGAGGAGTATAGGAAYGSETEPLDLGSGGGVEISGCWGDGSMGGGAVRLTVNGIFNLLGLISANGRRGCGAGGIEDGGGSGGSVYLTVNTLQGNGLIAANGGTGNAAGASTTGGGGGGRVAIYYAADLSSIITGGRISVLGGKGVNYGLSGTVYVHDLGSFGQSDYRWFQNADSVTPGSPLAAINTSASINSNEPVRLRLNVAANGYEMYAGSRSFNLEVATDPAGPWSSLWWNPSWLNRKKITLDNSTSPEDLANFPLLIALDSTKIDYGKTKASGADLRFIDPDGAELDYEIEKWDTSGTSYVWVKIPVLDKTGSDYVYMYYNNPSAQANEASAEIWEEYKAVHHLEESAACPTVFNDSTGLNDGVCGGAPIQTDGQVGFSRSFSSTTSDFIDLSNNDNLKLSQGSVGAWIKTSGAGTSYRGILSKEYAYSMFLQDNVFVTFDWGGSTVRTTGVNLADNAWHYVSETFQSGVASGTKLYIDGEPVLTTTMTVSNQNYSLEIGRGGAAAPTQLFNGVIDEARVSGAVRSPAWIKAEYRNMKGLLDTAGTEEGFSGWSPKNNASVDDGAVLSGTLLASSNIAEAYQEKSGSTANPITVPADGKAEYDFSLSPSGAETGIYYFRLTLAGAVLDSYANYPAISVTHIEQSLSQETYRWYENADSLQPMTPLAAENAEAAIGPADQARLRMSLSGSAGIYSEQLKLQYSTDVSGPWLDVGNPALWWSHTFKNRRKITFDNSASTENLVNFPVLISLNQSNIDYAKTHNNGADIRFVDPDGTELKYEIEKWDSSGTSSIWVKIPQLSKTNTDYIWMYYNNATATDAQTPTEVWDDNFSGVWHQSDSQADPNVSDSVGVTMGTAQANTATKAVSGKMGGALTYNGTSDYVSLGSGPAFTPTSNGFTVSGWYSFDSLPPASSSNRMWLSGKGNTNNFEWALSVNNFAGSYGKFVAGVWSPSGSGGNFRGSNTLPVINTWYYVTWTVNSPSSTPDIYVNGILDNDSTATAGSTAANGTAAVRIGSRADNAEHNLAGKADEFRISSIKRSNSWIKAEFLNMNGQMNSVGGEETATAWNFYDNPAVEDGSDLSIALLSDTSTTESYGESNPTPPSKNVILAGQKGEYDFSVSPGLAVPGVQYYFRLVKSDDSVLDSYSRYPVITVSAPASSLTQADYRWFANLNGIQPGTALADENAPGIVGVQNQAVRLRMNLAVADNPLAAQAASFKLQWSNSPVGQWHDVAVNGTGFGWKFKANAGAGSGNQVSSLLLSASSVKGTYEDSGETAVNPEQAAVGQKIEYDFSLDPSILTWGDNYFFRLVKSNGPELNFYLNYPSITIGAIVKRGNGGAATAPVDNGQSGGGTPGQGGTGQGGIGGTDGGSGGGTPGQGGTGQGGIGGSP